MSSPPRQTRSSRPEDTILADDAVMSSSSCLLPPRSPVSSRKLIDNSNRIAPSSPTALFDFKAINSHDLLEMAACPCCRQTIDDNRPQTLNGRPRIMVEPYHASGGIEKSSSLDSDDEEMLPKGVAEGLNYHPRKIIVEGWLHKKGTGRDWLGSKSWKPRWARLVMATLEGFEVDVPLLMIYWYEGTSSPSNVIILDSTVAFPIDIDDKLRWDSFRFDIRNARSVASNTTMNRTFCAPKKARDAWIYAISQALLMYEKANDKARKASARANGARQVSPQPPMYCRQMTPPYEEVWSGDRFVSPEKGATIKGSIGLSRSPPRMPSTCPPTSPKSRNTRIRTTAKRSVPRPDPSQLQKTTVQNC